MAERKRVAARVRRGGDKEGRPTHSRAEVPLIDRCFCQRIAPVCPTA
jgi:hypothetical protein